MSHFNHWCYVDWGARAPRLTGYFPWLRLWFFLSNFLSINVKCKIGQFFKYIVAKKMVRWRWIVIKKWRNKCLRLLTMLLTSLDLHCVGPLVLWVFSQNLFAKYRWRPKKCFAIYECRSPGTVPHGKSAPGYCITFITRLMRAWDSNFRTKLLILCGYTYKLVGENWIDGARAPWSSILLLIIVIIVVRVYVVREKWLKKLKLKKQ